MHIQPKTILFPIVFLIGAIAVWGVIQSNEDPSNTNSGVSNTAGTRYYTSEQGGVSFSYPARFGEVREQILPTGDPNDLVAKGSGLELTFEKNQSVSLLLAASDFEAFKREMYRGEDFSTLCPTPNILDETGNGCQFIQTTKTPSLFQTKWSPDEGTYVLYRRSSFQVPDGRYRGLLVLQNFPTIDAALNREQSDEERKTEARAYSQQIHDGALSSAEENTSLQDVNALVDSIEF